MWMRNLLSIITNCYPSLTQTTTLTYSHWQDTVMHNIISVRMDGCKTSLFIYGQWRWQLMVMECKHLKYVAQLLYI